MTTTTTIKTGDSLTIRQQWRDPGDESIEWLAVEDEDGGRVLIEAQVDLPIKPTQRVSVEMVELCDEPDFTAIQDPDGMWAVWCESDACIEQTGLTQEQAERLAAKLNAESD